MEFIKLTIDEKKKIAYVNINRPETKNALNFKIFMELEELFTSKLLDNVNIVILSGYNNEYFSSGIDLKELSNIRDMPIDEMSEKINKLQNAITAIERFNKPVIALIYSFCFGSAMEIALACDFIIADDKCSFGMFETKFGIIPDLGGTTRLVNRVGPVTAKKIIYFAQKFSATEALSMGVIDWVYPRETIVNELNKIIRVLLNNSSYAISISKKTINNIYNKDLIENLDIERENQMLLLPRDEVYQRIRAYLSRFKNQ